MAAANDRRIEAGIGGAEVEASRSDFELFAIRKESPEQPGARRNLNPVVA